MVWTTPSILWKVGSVGMPESIDPESTRGGEMSGEPYVQPSLFMHIVKSLKPGGFVLVHSFQGQDLTRVLIPVFFLSPRSLLEHLGDMLMHIDLLDSPE